MNGLNISFPIYYDVDGVRTSFHNLILRKAVVNSVVMSLSDKITGDVVYNGSDLEFTMKEYIIYNDVKYSLVSPPTVVREGLVKDNSDLKGGTRYSFEFYHPMYMLSNFPFTDVAVSIDEMRYKSQDKVFGWIGKPADYVAKLNKNLENTEFVVVLSESVEQGVRDTLSDVLSFSDSTIADALKTGYDTWGLPYVVDKLNEGEYFYTTSQYPNGRDYYDDGKRFVIIVGLPANEIYNTDLDQQTGTPFVFRFGQGVGLKNNSRTPRNNKIVTRIAGYGSERNIPYGYPQIRWYGDPNATCTIGNSVGPKQNQTINGVTYDWVMSYPIYDGIVGGEWVKLIKHPFTRKHLMPTVYADGVFNKVSQFLPNGSVNPNFNPDLEIVDYYDAVEGDDEYSYKNTINLEAPSYAIKEFEDIHPELGEAQILGATPVNTDLTDAATWDDTMDDDGNYLQSYFKIQLPQLTFDIYACAAITEEMQINMRSGACIGCTFTVQVDWEDYKRNFYDSEGNFDPEPHTTTDDGHVRDITKYPDSSNGPISVVVQKDINTFGTLMPNIYQNPAAGDAFVVLGISLPLSYITSAQTRLDAAMKGYMFGNNIHYFDYPLKFDEHFLAKHLNTLNQIRPNTIIRFDFNDEELSLFVKQLTIKYNEGVLPQYDITLTDNVEVVLNQIGQVADDVEKLGALIAAMRQSVGGNVAYELARKLSKVYDDAASGHITFTKGATFSDIGFLSGFLGHGARIDKNGNGEFERVDVRGSLHAAELVFNQIDAEEGESIRSIGHGEIETVTIDQSNPNRGTATLKLDGDEWATISQGDICRGLYNTISKDYSGQDEGEDENGFRDKKGFFSSYFRIIHVMSGKGMCTFTYQIQVENKSANQSSLSSDTPIYEHPCPLMKFAVYGNIDDNKKERQSSIYTTAVGVAPRKLFLAGVNDWKIKPENIKIASGNLEGLVAWEEVTEAEYNDVSDPSSKKTWDEEVTTGGTTEIVHHYAILRALHGDAGFYCEDNIYLGGIINQFKSAAMDAIASQITNIGQAQVRCNYDSYPVDCDKDGKILPPGDSVYIAASLWLGGTTRLNIESVNATWNGVTINGQVTDNTWEYNLELVAGQTLTSGVVSIVITGTDTNNNSYTASKTISIIANRQGQQGDAGTSASRLDVIPDSVVIDCDENGIIKSGSNNMATISGRLFVGNTQVVPTSYSIVWNGTSENYSPIGKEGTTDTSVDTNGTVSRTFDFVADDVKALASTYVTISVVGGGATITKTIPIIANWQGLSGSNGQDAVRIKTNIDSIVVDCSAVGEISTATSPTINAELYVGSEKVTTLTTRTMSWSSGAGNTYTPSIVFVSNANGTMSRRISFEQGGSTLASSAILITLSNGSVTATKSIPVFANRQGVNGDNGDNGIGYTAQLSRSSDSIVVDAIGQIVGGLGDDTVGWRLNTEVMIWDSVNERQLTCNTSAASASDVTDGQFMMSVVATDCSTSTSGSVVSITSIANTTSAGAITDFDAMRAMNGCNVEITATTYDGVVTKFVFPITIAHIDHAYITFDLTNEYDSMSYSLQTKRYVGLPIDTYIKAYANGDELVDITEVGVSGTLMENSVTVAPIINGGTRVDQTAWARLMNGNKASGLRIAVSSNGRVRFDHTNTTSSEIDIDDAKHTFNIYCKVKYAGVEYTSPTYQFVVDENTDTTLYKLIPSASAISEEDGIYSPNAISVNVSKTDSNGTTIVSESELEASGSIKVRYASSALTSWTNATLQNLDDTCPQNFAQVDKAITIFLLDVSNNAAINVLDVETITINKGGKDGAGQAYIDSVPDQFVIDCDETGKPLTQRGVTLFGALMWGNYRCDIESVSNSQMTYTTSSGNTPTMGNVLWDVEGKRIKRTFTFSATRTYNSGYATITLTGTDDNGNEHTATKTIPFYINRRGVGGGTGEAGRGIVSVITYYKAFPIGSNVTPPETDVDPTTQGWSATYIDATEENPYLWRFTRTTYTKEPLVEQTNAELIYVWSNTTNPNLLADTEFITGQMSMWNKMGKVSDNETGETTISNSTQYQSHNAFCVMWENSTSPNASESGYIRFLEQRLYDKLRTGSWYTISFWLKGTKNDVQSTQPFRLPLQLSQLADTTNGSVYMDGQSVGTQTYLQYEPTSSWVKHTATFKAKELDATASILWDMFTTFYSQSIWIAMPKLEVGRVATPYEAMRTVSEPITRTSTWEEGKQYYQGAAGEPFLDIVRCNNQWNKCKLSHISNESNKPVQDTRTAFWDIANDLSFIATDLILADQAVIRLVQSQKILMTNDKNQLTASINYDGDGGYCIYYPASGNKMMEFSSDGYIKYYRDESGNDSLEWKLGFGGSIIGHNSDDWKPIKLYRLPSNGVNFVPTTTFNRETYYQFVDGDLHNYADYDGAIYSGHSNNDPTDLTSNPAVATGWYTPNTIPWQSLSDDGETTLYAITMYRIVKSNTNPKIATITQTWTRYYDGESYTNEQDS